ncbi:MAG TPA: alpha/beta hydrolase [Gemmatimonadaceae bacterium]|jgi:non-heme chloroperoxidase|nr:alpha/beta hydrolase [Gemmatimonadaceae bacterium]
MMSRSRRIVAAAALLGSALHAQSIAGTWQGAVTAGGSSFRQVLMFAKGDTGWKAVYYSLDEAGDSVLATSAVLDGRKLKLSVPPHFSESSSSFEATFSPDGRSLTGTWIDSDGRYPLTMRRVTAKEAWTLPPSHTIRLVQVDTNVRLEVLDWGGSGRPLVFMSGLGGTAHGFDSYAPKFTPKYHVYGITRRGFGASSSPPFTRANYRADRLGDDVLAVLDSLGLHRPVLVGHSIAGEELSSIGSRYPAKVAGLIYLDAGYGYALYDRSRGDFILDRGVLVQQLRQLEPGRLPPADLRTLVHTMRDSTLPRFEKDIAEYAKNLDAMPAPADSPAPDTTPNAGRAILDGIEKYTSIPVPILAIYAVPHRPLPMPGTDSATRVRMQARFDSVTAAYATSFENGVPTAHVVRIPNATHFVFQSNEAEVLREMTAFLATLPQP